jgi:hypothetical protein
MIIFVRVKCIKGPRTWHAMSLGSSNSQNQEHKCYNLAAHPKPGLLKLDAMSLGSPNLACYVTWIPELGILCHLCPRTFISMLQHGTPRQHPI